MVRLGQRLFGARRCQWGGCLKLGLSMNFPFRLAGQPGFNPVTDPRFLDEIGAKLSEILAKSPAADIEKNARALLAAFFDRFDLVTRDDFEVQKRVLERAQARIAELELRLGETESGEADGRPHR